MKYLVLAALLIVAGCKGCCPPNGGPGSADGAFNQVFSQDKE